ncbi:MAG: phospholipase D family protein [Desulfuromonas sp.]|nr:MAG: phospholipase D family protein [Desulfuromonas sp.]
MRLFESFSKNFASRFCHGWVAGLILFLYCLAPVKTPAESITDLKQPPLGQLLKPLFRNHPGKSGAYVLERGEESLLARAWLCDRAEESIEVQYFIWSTDNIGILAAETLLRAAERGVKVRVIVDDLLVDADEKSLRALNAHPNIDIRIYNPRHSVGVSRVQQIFYLAEGFRASNQRMHDKTLIIDGKAAITGGRNMADEYFDYNQEYNFRDRDILLLGPVAQDVRGSFELFWKDDLAVPIRSQLKPKQTLTREEISQVYSELHAYASAPTNFAPEVRRTLEDLPKRFPVLLDQLVWDKLDFLHDAPGKNPGQDGLQGGGATTEALIETVRKAKHSITIQSPYLVFPEGGLELFGELASRGVDIRISTNSLAATDNIQAFSGYRKQRRKILKAGVKVFEFRPDPAIRQELIERYPTLEKSSPVFALHAKTMVLDGETLFIGTFNFDPRSANLNTEVGVLVRNSKLARQVERAIQRDMSPENSWEAADNPDSHASWLKRIRLQFWKLLPMNAIL